MDFNLESLRVGQTIGCSVNKEGELHYFIDDSDKGVGWTGLPTDKPMWGFADIYGLARKIKSEFAFGKSLITSLTLHALCLSLYLCLSLSFSVSLCLSLSLYIYLSLYLSLSICLSVSLSLTHTHR